MKSKFRALASVFFASAVLITPLAANSNLLELSNNQQAPTFTIKFNDIGIVELIDYIGQISNKNFIYDESQLNFKISIVSDEPATADQLLAMLLQILNLNSFSVSEEGNNILIYQSGGDGENEVKYLPSVVSNELNNQFDQKSGLITRIFKIRYAEPKKVAELISKLASSSKNVAVHDETKHVIVVDVAQKIEHIADLIESIDQLGSKVEFELYKVKHANISALKAYTEKIMAPMSKKTDISTTTTTLEAAAEPVMGLTLVPNMSANAIFIIGSRELIDKTLSVLKIIDVPSELEIIANTRKDVSVNPYATNPAEILDRQINPEFYIYKLQYHRGDQIVSSLKEIANGMVSTHDSLDPKLVYTLQTMQWIETTNSLIFSGDDASIIKLKNLIMSLDTPVKQVFLEMLVVDTTIGNSLDFGVDLGGSFTWESKNIAGSFGNYGSNATINSRIATDHDDRVVNAPTAQAQGFSLGVIGQAISHKGSMYHTLGAMVRALQVDADTNIVMNPKIITEDNVTATFFVGSQTRVKTGIVQNSGQNDVTSSNFEIMDVGTTINVTPTISHDELITLVLEQEVSSSLNTSSATDTTALVPLTKTSRTSTRMHVPDNRFLVIAGMVEDTKTNTRSAMPCLGGIPAIGRAFSYDSGSDSKRNLLFFIRPSIVRTPEEARILTKRYQDIVRITNGLPQRISSDLSFFEDEE